MKKNITFIISILTVVVFLCAIGCSNPNSSTESNADSSNAAMGADLSFALNRAADYETIKLPFTKDGKGEFYWKFTALPENISSWNLDKLEINGKDITNVWVAGSDLPAKQSGFYYVHYVGSYGWSHVEIKGKSGDSSSSATSSSSSTPTSSSSSSEPASSSSSSSSTPSGPVAFDMDVPMGWAVVPGYGLQTTTGGAGGEVVTATSHGQLKSYVSGDTPRIVKVSGSISGGDINVGSNKTIIGVGSNTKLSGFYLNMNGAKNIIIRNLEITGGTDAIAARKTNHLWIDHVFTHKCSDGLIDLTRETDMYTVSWSEFQNHHKTMLLNGGSRHYDDRGKLNGTLHHNYFNGTDTRNPRAGFGMIHIFNDYNYKNSYAIGFHTECKVLAEKNYFQNTKRAIKQMYKNADERGDAKAVDNYFDNASGNDATGVGFEPTKYYLYDYLLDEAKEVASIVKAGAGQSAKYGEIGLMPIPGQGAVNVSNSTLTWKTGTQKPSSYVVYFGTSNNPPQVAKTTSNTYDAGSLSSGKIYYWRVDQVTSSGTVQGKLWFFKAK